jgi:ATP-dependent DNA helicase RecG
VLNAVTHKDYSCGNPIQISVYNDSISIWNEGQLPKSWTVQRLLNIHPSLLYNPDIANTFFRAGYIDCWGTGTLKMREECAKVGLPEPVFSYNGSAVMVLFNGKSVRRSKKTGQVGKSGALIM